MTGGNSQLGGLVLLGVGAVLVTYFIVGAITMILLWRSDRPRFQAAFVLLGQIGVDLAWCSATEPRTGSMRPEGDRAEPEQRGARSSTLDPS